MKKLFFLLMAFSLPLIFSSCSSDEPVANNEFRTRSNNDWCNTYIEALDELMEGGYAGDDEVSLVLLSSTDAHKYLPDTAYDEFVKLAKASNCNKYPEYIWEKTAYVAQEGSDWVIDNKGNYLYPYTVRNVLYVLSIDEDGFYFKYLQPYGANSEYIWNYDPK
ncbi:MAG: hypothetical protein K2M93_08060 [Muribaculaceae bacterium]|nr:hypothetical protein [Muribaculaceae bacterium]